MNYSKVRFGDVCNLIRGVSYKSTEYSNPEDSDAEAFVNLKCVTEDGFRKDGVKYYKGNHKSMQSIRPGDLLIANTDLTRNRAVIGNSILVPNLDRNNACFSMDLCKIEIKNEVKIDKTFLYYYLKSPKARWFMINHSDGSTVVHLSISSVSEMEIESPALEEQKKIAKILSSIDAKIECNNRINDNLFEVCEQLLNQYLSKASQNSRTIADFLNVFTGKKNANETNPDGKYVFFSCAPETLRSDTYIYDGPAIIIAGNGAYTGRTRFYDGKMELYQRTYACVPKNAEIKRLIYGFYIYMKTHFEREKMGGTHGSAIPYIVIGDITKYEIPYEEDMFKNYAINVTPLVKKIQDNITENRRLIKLRDTLLPELLNGKVDVSNIDI